MYTKDYLKSNGWQFQFIFGFSTEIWTKDDAMMFVDIDSRELILWTKGVSYEE